MTLGNKIHKTREKLGISQMGLAERIRVTPDAVKQYESDIRATGMTWENFYGDSTKCLQFNKNVRLILTRIRGVCEPEYAAQLDIHMKWGDVRKEWTLVPDDLPDTWETMQDLAEGAAQLYLSELFDNIAPVLQILEDR